LLIPLAIGIVPNGADEPFVRKMSVSIGKGGIRLLSNDRAS
jgi:hypothetical protein